MLSCCCTVNSVMWAEGWERSERDKSQRVGQLLPERGPDWMGIRHHEQETGPPSKLGFLIFFARGSITACALCRYRLIVCCVNTNATRVQV
jgi:asparagine synthetase B (glutamine-hydrolysing)